MFSLTSKMYSSVTGSRWKLLNCICLSDPFTDGNMLHPSGRLSCQLSFFSFRINWPHLIGECVLSLIHVQFSVTPWTVTCQAPLSVGILQARILEWVVMPLWINGWHLWMKDLFIVFIFYLWSFFSKIWKNFGFTEKLQSPFSQFPLMLIFCIIMVDLLKHRWIIINQSKLYLDFITFPSNALFLFQFPMLLSSIQKILFLCVNFYARYCLVGFMNQMVHGPHSP